MPSRTCDPTLPGALATSVVQLTGLVTAIRAERDDLIGGAALLNWDGYAADAHAREVHDLANGLKSAADRVEAALIEVSVAQQSAAQKVADDDLAYNRWLTFQHPQI